jgi:hypothetical protein
MQQRHQVVQISELLVEQEDEIEFAHLSFQEYLAAAEIARTQQEAKLYDHFEDDWWKPTILLYGGLVNPTHLIRKMLELGANDLAYACWQDTTKRIDSELAAELQGMQNSTELIGGFVMGGELAGLQKAVETSRYEKLENYLKNGQWEEADDETYRLMITAVGKEVGQGFTADELLNFPCDELKAIDGLWVKYSNGKFGFSVQKDLYLECGGIPDGKYHKEAWDKFCEANGWKGGGIKFDITSPKAHLPSCRWYGFGGGSRGNVFSLLFSRIQTCKL